MPRLAPAHVAAALEAKYEELRALRGLRSTDAPRERLQRLAERFPGALRELDALADDEIERRLTAVRRAREDGLARWMLALFAYHAHLRALLRIKRWLARERDPSPETRARFEREHEGEPRMLAWAARLSDVARPPSGRVTNLALESAARTAAIPIRLLHELVSGARQVDDLGGVDAAFVSVLASDFDSLFVSDDELDDEPSDLEPLDGLDDE